MGSPDHQQYPNSAPLIIKEYDFFDEHRTGPRRTHIFNASDDSSDSVPPNNNPRTITLLGVNIRPDSTGSVSIENDVDDQEKMRSRTKAKKRKSRNPEKHIARVLPVPSFHPTVLEDIRQRRGSEPQFMFEKKLEESDVKVGQNRLFITRSDTLMAALTEEERKKVVGKTKSDRFGVLTRDPNGNEYGLQLTRWGGVGIVVLNHGWRNLVGANKLQKGDSVQGWGYRVGGGEFRLAINIVRKEEERNLRSHCDGGGSGSSNGIDSSSKC